MSNGILPQLGSLSRKTTIRRLLTNPLAHSQYARKRKGMNIPASIARAFLHQMERRLEMQAVGDRGYSLKILCFRSHVSVRNARTWGS